MFALFLGIAAATCKAGKNVGVKFATAYGSDGFVGWGQRATTLLCLLPVLFIAPLGIPTSPRFLGALIAATLILGAGAVLTTRALRLSDISLVTPILSLTPLLVTVPAYFLLDERPTTLGLAGIVCIAIGAYLLNITDVNRGPLEPLRALASDKGVQTAAVVVVLSATLPAIDKIGIQASSPLLWPLLTHAVITVVFLPLALRTSARTTVNVRRVAPFLLAVGFANALLWIAQAYAYTLTDVAYITALKRLSLPLNILAGHVFFEERVALARLPAALVIVFGVILLSVGGI